MATKANLVDYIVEKFEEPDGSKPSKAKLEACKKKDLEDFIKENGSIDKVDAWVAENSK